VRRIAELEEQPERLDGETTQLNLAIEVARKGPSAPSAHLRR